MCFDKIGIHDNKINSYTLEIISALVTDLNFAIAKSTFINCCSPHMISFTKGCVKN